MKKGKLLKLQTNVNTQDNEKSNSNSSDILDIDMNEYENMSKYEIMSDAPFVLVEGNEGWIIVMGEHVVSEKKFKTKDEAMKYVYSKPWELIFVGASAYMKMVDKIEKDKENFKNLNNEQES